jgi:hypothetical protein
MPYSITTRDGITVNDIPDDMPADSPQLKDRVAKIRGGAAAAPPTDVKAPTSGYAMGLRDTVDAGAQMLRRVAGDKVGGAIDTFGNWLADKGLPVAHSNGVEGVDRIVNDVNRGYEENRKAAGRDGFDAQRLVGNLVQPANYIGPAGGAGAAANTVRQLAVQGAKAGAVSGFLQPVVGEEAQKDFWVNKAEQTGAGAVTGAVATPVVTKGAEKAANLVKNALPQRTAQPQNIQIAVNNTFASQGMNPREVPEAVMQSVQRQVDEAMRAGRRLNAGEMVRRAQFEAVGLTGDAGPTAAQLSRNPVQFANEKDLSGVRISTPRGDVNPLADRFANQHRRLQDVFDQMGAREATQPMTAGQTIIGGLREADAPVRQRVDDLYTRARGMNEGRAWDLERGVFSHGVNRELDEGMWGAFVPSEVRTLLNNITEGRTPFNVDAAVQIDSLLSKAQRKAERGGDDAGASAVGVIRRHLHGTPLAQAEQGAGRAAGETVEGMTRNVTDGIDDVAPRMQQRLGLAPQPSRALTVPQAGGEVGSVLPQVPGAPPVHPGQAARDAFDQARHAARDRFATIEATPSLRAALDEAAPDKFVQNFILNADTRDVQAMRQTLANNPDALEQARAQVAEACCPSSRTRP